MISLYVGTPGSGKTYEVVKLITDQLRLGRTVCTNVDGIDKEIYREAIRALTGLDTFQLATQLFYLPEEQVKTFWLYIKPKALIIIDEAQNYFNCRDFKDKTNRDFGTFASTHRHNGYDLVLLTQSAERVDSAVRALCQWTYKFRKLDMFGQLIGKKGYRYWTYPGGDCDCKPFAEGNRVYDSRLFSCYKSYVSDDIKELPTVKMPNVLKHPVFFLIPIVLVVFVFLFSKSSLVTGDMFGAKKALASRATVKVLPVSPVVSVPSVSSPAPSVPVSEKSYPPVPLSSVAPVPDVVSDVPRLIVDRHSYKDVFDKCELSLTVKAADLRREVFDCDVWIVYAENGKITESFKSTKVVKPVRPARVPGV